MPAGEVAWHEPNQGGTQPCPRAGHTVNLVGQKVFMFGGCGLDNNKTVALNDTHILELGVPGSDNARWVEQAINGEPPEGRWRHTATTVDTKIFIFGGLVDDKRRFNDLYVLDTDAFAWRKLNARGTHPAPRAHHTATFMNRQLIVYGGYGGSGRLFSELEALDVDQLQWSVLNTTGQSPKPRYDHTASLAANKLVVFGGRDHVQAIDDMCILDMNTLTWQQLKQDVSPEAPIPLYCHAAEAIESAISWKLFTFGGRKGLLEYTNTTFCMDTENMIWVRPPVNTEDSKGPCPREYCASLFDPKGARVLFFGGWANRWLGDLHALDISGIVGPSYAVTGVRPEMGPLSGGREVIVVGINFIQANKIEVKFTNGSDEEIVSGTYLSKTEIACESPSFEKHGAGDVEVKVMISGEIFTVNRVKYTYYNDTKASGCIAYGPGLSASRSFGTPASFVLQAKDTKGRNRTSGADYFTVRMVLNPGTKEEEEFFGSVHDNDDGTYICNYIPPAPGQYHIEVTLGEGDHIRGSPFAVKCSDPWNRPRVSGTAIKCEEERVAFGAQGTLMTFVEGKAGLDMKDGVATFDAQKIEWFNGTMSGHPPPKTQDAARVKFDNTLVSFGGLVSGTDGDMRSKEVAILNKEKHGNQWVWNEPVVSGEAPTPREGASAVHLPGSNKVVVTGGCGAEGASLDCHLLNVETASVVEWLAPSVTGESGAPRSKHASACTNDGQVFVFGGKLESQPEEPAQEEVTAEEPEAEAAAEVAAEVAAEEGEPQEDAEQTDEPTETEEQEQEGEAPEAEAAVEEEAAPEEEIVYLDDLTRLSVNSKDMSMTWKKLEPTGEIPKARVNAQMEVIDEKVIVYGGQDVEGNQLCDMHMYDPEDNSWKCIWNQLPPPESKPTQAFVDPVKKQLVMLDGSSGVFDAVEVLDLVPLLAKGEDLIGEMATVADKTLKDLEEFVSKEGTCLDTKVEEGDLDRLLKVMGALHDILSQQDDVDLRMDSLTESIQFLDEQGLDVSTQSGRLTDMKASWNGIKKRAPKIKAGIRTFQEREGRKIKHEIARFVEKIEAFREAFKQQPFFQFGGNGDEMYSLATEQHGAIQEVETRRGELAHLATLFECLDAMEKPTSIIEECREDLGLVKQFWDCASMIDSYFGEWAEVLWDDIDTESMEESTKKFKQELRVMNKKIRQEFPAYEGLLKLVNDQLASIPVVGELRQPCMRTRHWEQVVEMTKVEIDIDNIPSLRFKDLVALKLHEFVDDVGEIVDAATKEEKIENNLLMLEDVWADLEFEFTPYNDTDISLVKVSEETFETLEDNQVLVQGMAASRFVGQFQEQVHYWQKSLATVAEVIQILGEIQRTWSYLEDLFIHSDEVKRELPEDAERFTGIDEGVKEVLYECGDKPNLVQRCNAEGLYTFLEDLQHQLELCEKSLRNFQEAKKRAFPRFYFISSKDLLDILSNGNRPEKVMEHIPKIFQAIQKLDLKDDVDAGGADVKVALGMYSPEDEYVPFQKNCILDGKVEGWLHRVISHMRDGLRAILKESNQAYSGMKRVDLILEYQGQIVITTCQTWWCTEHTESTSAAMRLNSSKQPHEPLLARPLKISPIDL